MVKLAKVLLLLFLGVTILVVILPNISSAATSPALQQIYTTFTSNRDDWIEAMGKLLRPTFFSLLVISGVWQFYNLAIADQLSLGSILHLAGKFAIYGGLFFFLFENVKWGDTGGYTMLVTLIPDTFEVLARQITGYSVNIFDFVGTATQVFQALTDLPVGWDTKIALYLLACVVSVLFYVIIGHIILAKIEMVLVSLAGFVLLVFDGLMGMFNYWKTYLQALIACGFKLFLMNIVAGILLKFGKDANSLIADNGAFTAATAIAGTVVVMYLIVKNVPTLVATILSGSPGVMSSGNLMRIATAGAAAAIAASGIKGIVKSDIGQKMGESAASAVQKASQFTPSNLVAAGVNRLTRGKSSENGMMGMDDGSRG